jgi:hypothetical protein
MIKEAPTCVGRHLLLLQNDRQKTPADFSNAVTRNVPMMSW